MVPFVRSLATVTASVTLGIFVGRKTIKLPAQSETAEYDSCNPLIKFTPNIIISNVEAKKITIKDDTPIRSSASAPPKATATQGTHGKVTNRVLELMKYGFPNKDNFISYEDFVVSYDKRNRNANWVIEHLNKEKVEKGKGGVKRSDMNFLEDPTIHNFHRSTNRDYSGSGFDRGHLAAAANHRHSSSAMSQTFYLTNVVPQVGEGFNRDSWNDLEKYVRAVARKSENVYVCTGPLYLPSIDNDGKLYVKYQVIGENHVAVPTHLFKVVLIENKDGVLDIQSFVMPNQKMEKVKLKSFMVPIETIERAAGLNFFPTINRNEYRKMNASQTLYK